VEHKQSENGNLKRHNDANQKTARGENKGLGEVKQGCTVGNTKFWVGEGQSWEGGRCKKKKALRKELGSIFEIRETQGKMIDQHCPRRKRWLTRNLSKTGEKTPEKGKGCFVPPTGNHGRGDGPHGPWCSPPEVFATGDF